MELNLSKVSVLWCHSRTVYYHKFLRNIKENPYKLFRWTRKEQLMFNMQRILVVSPCYRFELFFAKIFAVLWYVCWMTFCISTTQSIYVGLKPDEFDLNVWRILPTFPTSNVMWESSVYCIDSLQEDMPSDWQLQLHYWSKIFVQWTTKCSCCQVSNLMVFFQFRCDTDQTTIMHLEVVSRTPTSHIGEISVICKVNHAAVKFYSYWPVKNDHRI